MPDPIGIASGILTLVLFAFQSSQALYQAVSSFQSNQRIVRELKEELEALDGVLQALRETATDAEADFAALKCPLLRCGKACQDFEAVIVKCTSHSDGSRTSFRDWAKLRYMGDDIVGFKNMLAGYKSTIAIALGDANIRRSVVTVKVLKEYKDLITNTTTDLEEHLREIDNKLQTLSLQGASSSTEDTHELQQIQEERDSTKQCLDICAQVSAHIEQVQPTVLENMSTPSGAYGGPGTKPEYPRSARLVTADAFNVCKVKLSSTTTQLESHLQDIDNRLRTLYSSRPKTPNEQTTEQNIREELESVKQCLAICAQASAKANQHRINDFEDVSMTDDGRQVIVSTIGDLVSAKRITAGARSLQCLGQMSDESLQHLSWHGSHIATEKDVEPQTETGPKTEPKTGPKFEGRYGVGVKLSSSNLKDV